MEPGELLATLGARLFGGVMLIAIPATGYFLANMVWHTPALVFFHRVTVLSRLALITGVLMGLGVVAAADERPSLDINEILAEGGAWDVSWQTFLVDIANPGLYGYAPVWQQLSETDLNGPWTVMGVLLCAAVLASAIATTLMLRGEQFLIGVVAMAYEIMVIQAVTMYVVLLVPYTLCTFNFWTALLALMVLQYYRHMKHGGAH
jgi:hypothetical protein